MTRRGFVFLAPFFALSAADFAFAALYDRGNGLIYDDVLDVTWLRDANFASSIIPGGQQTFDEASVWVDQLVYAGYDDWRLPTIANPNIPANNYESLYGTATIGEIGHLFFITLGNPSLLTTPALCQTALGCLLNDSFVDPFSGSLVAFQGLAFVESFWYFDLDPDVSEELEIGLGFSSFHGAEINLFRATGTLGVAWAVRDGDVSARPIPGSVLLYLSGLLAFANLRKDLAGRLAR